MPVNKNHYIGEHLTWDEAVDENIFIDRTTENSIMGYIHGEIKEKTF